MNFCRDVVDAAAPARPALRFVDRDGSARELSFGVVADAAARAAGTLAALGVRRGDVVMTIVGNRPEWVFTMLACFRLGAVALPCNEQLRAKDLALRLHAAKPAAIVVDSRNLDELAAARPPCPVVEVPGSSLLASEPAPAIDLDRDDPCMIVFTSGTAGEPKGVVHAQRYLVGQELQARGWLAAREGELAWCTAASGWSKSARNAFVAPWLCGATAMLHDGRFDAQERLDLLARERVNVLCMAPTEYRVIAKRAEIPQLPALRTLVAAGEALNPEVLAHWQARTGVAIRDGYGQTETGQLTANPPDRAPRPGSMGLPLPGIRARVVDGELVVDPATLPTFFLRYLDGDTPEGEWRTGDRVREDADGYLYFEGRADDVIISAGYRIGPFEVESALVEHPAVAEAAVVAAPDAERGSVVRAVVVLRDGFAPADALARELQEHVRRQTAPYKYPRVVDFVEALPKTASGKVRRARLRGAARP
jgi:acyl-coenzyme A synthetase/AMP-(fatty) acid ligase